MASNSKRSRDAETMFTKAEQNWSLEKLYADLREAKQKELTNIEKCHLRGLLCGCSVEDIATEREIKAESLEGTLSTTLYSYIKVLLNLDSNEKITHWSNVSIFLEKAGYKIQVSEPSQSSHSISGKQETTSEASKQLIKTYMIQESFFKLSSQNPADWLSAVLSLQKIVTMDDCPPDDSWRIRKRLAAFIKDKAPRKKEEEGKQKRLFPPLPNYIQEALTIIVQRDLNQNEEVIDLSKTDLRGAKFSKPNLHKVNLSGSNLKGVRLIGAILCKANFMGANLQNTSLRKAELQGANLFFADLQGAYLNGANLERAELWHTKLQGANLCRVNLQKAYFRGVDLTEVKNLQLKQIASANRDSTTRLPENISLPVRPMPAKPPTSLLIRAALKHKARLADSPKRDLIN